MTFANPLPWWGLGLVIAAAAVLAWFAYRRFAAWPMRRHVLSALRFVTLLALVFVLMRPVARLTAIDTRDVVVPVLVDVSRSMGIEDADSKRRIDAARELVTASLLPALAGRFDVQTLSFGERVAPVAPAALTATARRSDLAGALAEVRERYRGRAIAGVILVTDGGDTGGAPGSPAGSPAVPIYPVPVGSSDAGRDREVLGITAAEAILDGSRVDLAVSAVAHGSSGGGLELRLLENGRTIEVRHARLPADGGPVREIFQVSPPPGTGTIYSVQIPPAPGELVPENNSRSVLVQPPPRTRRILLVEGAPGFEHSFLKRALAEDTGLELDSVVRKGENETGNDTYYIQAVRGRGASLATGYPSDAASLFAYDAIIFANVSGDQLTTAQMEATREFVARRGGGLLVLGAQSFLSRGLAGTPIEAALPMEFSRRADTALPASGGSRGAHRVAVTDAGLVHPVTRLAASAEDSRKRWEGLPALAGAAALGAPRAGAVVLANTSASGGAVRPLVAVQRYGEGRSMVFAGEASWRWRMMLPSTDRTYETFWRQAVRWLAVGATDPLAVFPAAAGAVGDEVAIRAAVRDAAFQPLREADVDVRIIAPGGRIQHLRAAVDPASQDASFGVRFTPEEPGLHRVTVSVKRGGAETGSATGTLLVGGADVEMADPRVNRALLERLATASGGRMIAAGDSNALVSALQTGAPAAALAVRRDLWHNAWSFGGILVLLASEWLLRRRWGLR